MGCKINIFGTRFACPRGLHKSPGTNWLASCVAAEMAGKKFNSRPAVRAAFRSAAKECARKGKSGT